ncbi:putative fAD dependent oxidoreductase [Mycobacterium xenopi 3993]|nr:putative fAD dependent oxidoreductase [Mycobacterium xenopi 3993]
MLVIDAASFPRDKACGDGLTRARWPSWSDWAGRLAGCPHPPPRIADERVRRRGRGRLAGPSFPSTGSAVARIELDDRIRKVAEDSGARMLLGMKAVGARHDSCGRVRSLVLADGSEVGCGELIVADGARSPLGRVLGRRWHQDTVYGIAARGYLASPRSDEPWLTSHVEVRSPDGAILPGYGWIFPLGNGAVNIGVGALQTSKRPAHLALRPLMSYYADLRRDEWGFAGRPRRCRRHCCRWAARYPGWPGRTGCWSATPPPASTP